MRMICETCGAELDLAADRLSGKCPYCRNTYYFKEEKSDALILALNRARGHRLASDFHEARKEYKLVLDKAPKDAEAHFGMLLATYGIEFVEDKRLGKFIPTCHRFIDKDIFTNENYLAAIENASEAQRGSYIATAEQIANLQGGIKAKLDSEEPYDVFISYKAKDGDGIATEDSVIARRIYDELTKKGIKTFFSGVTLESRIGDEYEPIIYRALYSCKFFILVATKEEYINAPWVKNEWSRFEDRIAEEGLSGASAAVFKGISPYVFPRAFQTQGIDLEKHPWDYTILIADNIENKLRRSPSLAEFEELRRRLAEMEKQNAGAEKPKQSPQNSDSGNKNADSPKPTEVKPTEPQVNTGDAEAPEESAKWRVGSTVTFGTYYQKNKKAKQPIEWTVLAREGTKALVISKYLLDYQRIYEGYVNNTWENSHAREWLNGEFMNTAFNSAEQEKIRPARLVTPDDGEKLKGGNPTEDKIFLLSRDEVNKYFPTEASRKCTATPYAISSSIYAEDGSTVRPLWWLRASGEVKYNVVFVVNSAVVNENGEYEESAYASVRPALWIDTGVGASEDEGEQGEAPRLNIGDTVILGSYHQRNEGSGEPIAWTVLAAEGNKALLTSKYLLDCKQYNTEPRDTTWETSGIRKWLNGEFFGSAFSIDEQESIQASRVVTRSPVSGLIGVDVSGGEPTEDRVFLLSADEAEKYFPSNEERRCIPTEYAVSRGAMNDSDTEYSWWWLRSPGSSKQNAAAYVNNEGGVDHNGDEVNSRGASVRPVLWVNADALPQKDGGTKESLYVPQKGTDKKNARVKVKLADCKAGDTVTLGSYHQKKGKTKQAIEWTVLAREGSKALLTSKYLLDYRQYNSTDTDTTWESADIRKWLNGEFFGDAFGSEEQWRIQSTEVITEGNSFYGKEITGGAPTDDRVFLLSTAEINKYFPSREARKCSPTAYAVSRGAVKARGGEYSGWWLRSPGDYQNRASSVSYEGFAPSTLNNVNSSCSVRPAMWVSVDDEPPAKQGGGTAASSAEHSNKTFKCQGTVLLECLDKNIVECVIPEGITEIGKNAFWCCKQLVRVSLPKTLTEIGEAAFDRCMVLYEISVPSGVKAIRRDTFLNCASLEKVVLPSGLTEIGWHAFQGCKKLKNISIPDTVTYIGGHAFAECESLSRIEIPRGVGEVKNSTFLYCTSLSEVKLQSGITKIGDEAFEGCESLTEIVLPNTVTAIGGCAFYGCESLVNVVIPNSVTNINTYSTFAGCRSIKAIRIPERFKPTVKKIFPREIFKLFGGAKITYT